MGIIEVITAIINDMWIGLQEMDGGFIMAFLGIGSILLAIISGFVSMLND